ncbi:hypothetical protein O9992_11545 [Vibrio lentus]|nr:hypothetical protein [Vibrio lentus]
MGGGELNFSSDIDLIFTYLKMVKRKARDEVSPTRIFTRPGRRYQSARSAKLTMSS